MRSTSRSVFIITTLFLITLGFTGFLVSGRVYAFPGKLSVRAYVGLDWNFTPGFTAPACNFEGYTDTCSAPYRKFRKNLACRPDGSGIASAGNILLVGCRTVDCGIVDWSSNAINWPQVCAVGVGCTAEILDSFRIDHGTPSIANLSTTKYYAQGYKIFYKQDSSCQNFNVCINAADTPSFGSVNGSPVWHHYRFFWANPASDVKIPSFYLPHYGCPVPVDGGWAEWGPCSGTCGQTGTQTRACTNPSPKDGGKECLFEDGVTRGLTETRACTTPLCLCNAVCTGDAQCASGDCGSVAVGLCGCDDGDVCTADTCNVDGTCTHTPTPVNASWVLGTPGACSIPCGLGGTKLTSYVCNGISSCGGSPVCDPATKPADNISACDAADLCSCNGQCTGNEDCASPFECVGNVCKDPASAAFTWTGCNVANPASWGSCLGGTCGVPNSGTQTCTTASCPATCGGTCGPIPVKSCTPLACGLTSPCELVVGFSTASGSQCKSIKVNSQGLIYDGGRVICP